MLDELVAIPSPSTASQIVHNKITSLQIHRRSRSAIWSFSSCARHNRHGLLKHTEAVEERRGADWAWATRSRITWARWPGPPPVGLTGWMCIQEVLAYGPSQKPSSIFFFSLSKDRKPSSNFLPFPSDFSHIRTSSWNRIEAFNQYHKSRSFLKLDARRVPEVNDNNQKGKEIWTFSLFLFRFGSFLQSF